jgi:hypothetical protein
MDTSSVAYVLCRIEDDASLTPVSEHRDVLTGIAAGGYAVEVEDLNFAYALYAGDPSNERVLHDARCLLPGGQDRLSPLDHEDRAHQPQHRGPLRPRRRRVDGVIVAAKRAGSYEERVCLRCFEGRMYDAQRGAWVACERCSGTARVVVYVYPRPKIRPR